VEKIISNSVDLDSMKKNLELKKITAKVQVCLGLHPVKLLKLSEKEINESIKFIEDKINECIGIGESGLDFTTEKEDEREKQIKVFKQLIGIAKKYNKPIVVHSRKARKDVLEILEEEKAEKVLLHWFIGEKHLDKIIEKKYFISLGPSILFNDFLKKFVEKIPLEIILTETDSPVEFNGKKAEPFWVKEVAEKIAEIKKIPLEEVEEATYINAIDLFKK
jgi:TatD DNase family protein